MHIFSSTEYLILSLKGCTGRVFIKLILNCEGYIPYDAYLSKIDPGTKLNEQREEVKLCLPQFNQCSILKLYRELVQFNLRGSTSFPIH